MVAAQRVVRILTFCHRQIVILPATLQSVLVQQVIYVQRPERHLTPGVTAQQLSVLMYQVWVLILLLQRQPTGVRVPVANL